MEKAEEIVANYKSGGVAFELAKFIAEWEKQVEDMTSPLVAPTLPLPNPSVHLILFFPNLQASFNTKHVGLRG